MKLNLFQWLCFLSLAVFAVGCTRTEDLSNDGSPENSISINDISAENYSYKIYLADSSHADRGYGFDIYLNDKIFIHQFSIPAINGMRHFPNDDSAERTAKLMISKLEHNIMPPSISLKELDSLGILQLEKS